MRSKAWDNQVKVLCDHDVVKGNGGYSTLYRPAMSREQKIKIEALIYLLIR